MAVNGENASAVGALDTRGEAGAAILAAIAGLLMLAAIAAALNYRAKTTLLFARQTELAAQHKHKAEAGVHLALARLIANDTRDLRYDGTAIEATFDGVTLKVAVQAERGKVNLNQSPNEVFRRLVLTVCASEPLANQVAAELADFVDADDDVRSDGLEADGYAALGLAPPANQHLQSIAEIRLLPGMTETLFVRLRPHISVHAFNPAPEPRYASPFVRSILGANSEAEPDAPGDPGRAAGVYTITVTTIEAGRFFYRVDALVYITADQAKPFIMLDWRRGFVEAPPQGPCSDARGA
ncbi:MAG: type II secretion system protein GspK [Hyphomicrobiales bacterium]|nr:type II secretion system protein GspK [Hyphomicrobiales bacterium]